MHTYITEDTVRKTALGVGLAALAVGMGMAFEYGRAMSWLHAVSLGLLAITVSLAFIGAEIYRGKGRHAAAWIATIAGICFSAGEYGTHFGYTVGTRVAETQQTSVQNATHASVQENRDSEKANLGMWRARLKDLEAERSAMTKELSWLPTVTPDGLEAQVTNMQGDFVFKRSKSCADVTVPESRKFCDTLTALRNKVAAAKQYVSKADEAGKLEKQIAATQKILDGKVDVAAKTEFHSSRIVNQTEGFAQIATWSTEPSKSALNWTQLLLGAIIAAITTYLAPFCFSIAFSGLGGHPPQAKQPAPDRVEKSKPVLVEKPQAPNTHTVHTREVVRDEGFSARLKASVARNMPHVAGLAA